MDIVRCPALNQQTCELILEFMDEQGVTEVRYGVMKQSRTFVFTFNTPELQIVIKIGFIQAKDNVYIPDPLRCFLNVKCLATTKISVADTLCASTVVCLNIVHLTSVKDLPDL